MPKGDVYVFDDAEYTDEDKLSEIIEYVKTDILDSSSNSWE